MHSNREITYTTPSSLNFTSLYSHCNNYALGVVSAVLDSSLPYHLLANHFNIEIYKERTLICKVNLHEVAKLGAISLSHKYAIAVTKTRLVKVSITSDGGNKTSKNAASLIAA